MVGEHQGSEAYWLIGSGDAGRTARVWRGGKVGRQGVIIGSEADLTTDDCGWSGTDDSQIVSMFVS